MTFECAICHRDHEDRGKALQCCDNKLERRPLTDGGQHEQIPVLEDVLDYPQAQPEGERRWIVLYEDDYHNFGVDPDGNVAVLVDIEQTGEVLRLAADVLASLSHKDADSDDVIADLIDALQEVRDGDD